jgi:hypothetical protein
VVVLHIEVEHEEIGGGCEGDRDIDIVMVVHPVPCGRVRRAWRGEPVKGYGRGIGSGPFPCRERPINRGYDTGRFALVDTATGPGALGHGRHGDGAQHQ